ncbi:MAG TPA: methyltransferase domain-containing protein, partial [Dermatophilaceae bacterium]
SLGFRTRMLPMMRDVDTPADAANVARIAPDGRFGRLHRRLTIAECSPTALYDEALDGDEVDVYQLQGAHAVRRGRLAVKHWQQMAPADEILLSRCEGPVLDVGCGPGRLVESLAARGTATLGIDISARAVTQTAARGGSVLQRAVQQRLPGEGRWGTVLLADGNIGIGGDPEVLLLRCHDLLTAGGVALVEADSHDDTNHRVMLRLRGADGRVSSPMPWARLGSLPLIRLASRLGFVAVEDWRVDGRVFIALRKVL